jgi:hypothetical protein
MLEKGFLGQANGSNSVLDDSAAKPSCIPPKPYCDDSS